MHLPLGECFSVCQIVLFACQPEILPLKDFIYLFILIGWIFADAVLILSSFPHEAIPVHFL